MKDLILRPIEASEANKAVLRLHYSGTVVRNSQLHIGVFWQGRLEGVLQFGPSLDKRKTQALVRGTAWHEFLELNRLAFSERLPRNSESRAIAVALRLLRQHAPQVKWVISFADGTQCGDGTIYRAAGFLLTGIKPNTELWLLPDGTRVSGLTLRQRSPAQDGGASSMASYRKQGARPLPGFQMRYVKFLDPAWAPRLTVPVLPYSAIDAAGARMYRGRSADGGTAGSTGKGRFNSDPPAPPHARS